ncbi:hypothetical protein ACGYK5_17295 [Sulfitobacter sp. 1A16787]|uniref:hypothetical protein n=1 Tax=Sulfitobacter sp. 1A16787 TaxID=3368571 RepID=UPI003744BCAC
MFNSFSIKHADPKSKIDASRALRITLIINFLPLVIGFIAIARTAPIVDASVNVFFSGELYFYAMSLCASIYLTSQLSRDDGNMNMRLWSGVFVLCCAAFMAFYLGDSETTDDGLKTFHGLTSVLFLIVAVVLNYRVMVLAEDPPPSPEDIHRNKAKAMASRVDPDYD